MEEAGSKINHRRKYADRHPGIMHCDQAAFELGHQQMVTKYCLVAAVTIEVDKCVEVAHLSLFQDAICATAALKEALSMCDKAQFAPDQGFSSYPHPGRWRW